MDSKLSYCSFLHDLADRIKNVNQVHGNYSILETRRGNERKLLILSNELKKLLPPTTNGNTNVKFLRKFTLFLIVNSKLNFQYNLEEDPNIASCLDKCIPLSPCVLMNLIWDLNLEDCFYEAIALTPHWMSLVLLDAAKNNIDHLEPFDLVFKTRKLVEVAYYQITRLQFVEMNIAERQDILSAFLKFIVGLLKNFISPPSDRMSSWSSDKMTEYIGRCLQNVYEMVLYCLNKFVKMPSKKWSKSLMIYNVRVQNVPYKVSDSITRDGKYHPAIFNTLSLLNDNLLDTCTANVKSVKLIMFICWLDIAEDDCEDNLQYIITKLSYDLQQFLIQNKFKHDVLMYLQNFAKKPKTLDEKIADADVSTVIRCVNLKNENQKAWFNKLVDCDALFSDITIRQCFEKNIALADADNIITILQKILDTLTLSRIKIEPDEKEIMKQLFLKALKSVKTVEGQIRAVQRFLIHHGSSNILQTNDFENMLNTVFNKTIVMDNYKLTQMLCLIVQNVEKVYKKTIETCIKNSKQIDMMCIMLETFKEIGNIRFNKLTYESVNKIKLETNPLENENIFITTIVTTFEDLVIEEHDSNNFTKFIYNIKNVVIEVESLFSKFFMPAIQLSVSNTDYEKLLCLVKGLNMICDDDKMKHLYAPMLVIMAQVLEFSRWDLLSFANIKVQIVSTVIGIIQKVGTKFLKIAEDKSTLWLQTKLKNLKTINKIHFNCLFQNHKSKNDLVWHPIFPTQSYNTREETIAYLCEYMTKMVPSELKLLKINDPDLICGTMKAIIFITDEHKDQESTVFLLLHHFKLCAFLLKDKIPFSDLSDNLKYFHILLNVLNDVPLEYRENCCLALINILTILLNSIVKNELSEEIEKKLEIEILKLDCVQTQGILIKMLCLSKENTSGVLDNSMIKEEIDNSLLINKDIIDNKMEL